MASRIGRHLHANLVGYLALLVALSGSAYAANKIGSNDIKTGAVKSKQIGNDQVKSKDLKDGKAVKSKDVKLSSFPIRLNVPPTSWVPAGIPVPEVEYFIGQAQFEQGGGAGTSRSVFANVQAPNQIAGERMELKSFELCYEAGASAVLTELAVRTILSTSATLFSDTTVISDDSERTDSGCREYEPDQRVVLGPNEFIEPDLSLNLSGGTFRVYRATLVLEPA